MDNRKKLKEELKIEIKKILMDHNNISLTDVVKLLNEKYQRNDTVQNLNGKLTRGSLTYVEAKEIADILNCEIKWISKDI